MIFTSEEKERILDYLNGFHTIEEAILGLDKENVVTLEYIGNYELMRDGTQYKYFSSLEDILEETNELKNINEKILSYFEINLDDDFNDVRFGNDYFEDFEDMEDFLIYYKELEDQTEAIKEMRKYINLESFVEEYASSRDYSSYSVY